MTVHTNHKGQQVVGPLSNDKQILRNQLALILLRYRLSGRKVTVCHPAVAIGSGFSPNKHPFNSIVGAQSPLTV